MNRRSAALCRLGLLCALSAPCWGADPLSSLLACRDVADAAARLACFDREAATLAAAAPSQANRGDTEPAPPSAPPSQANRGNTEPAPPTAAPTAAPAPSATSPPLAAAPALDAKQQFGLPEHTLAAREVAAGTRPAPITKIQARLVTVGAGADGRVIFRLDNDQVWRQLLTEGDLLAKPGDAVTVSRGVFGSYWLEAPSGRGCKVTRLR